jgi:hypothetical protein
MSYKANTGISNVVDYEVLVEIFIPNISPDFSDETGNLKLGKG